MNLLKRTTLGAVAAIVPSFLGTSPIIPGALGLASADAYSVTPIPYEPNTYCPSYYCTTYWSSSAWDGQPHGYVQEASPDWNDHYHGTLELRTGGGDLLGYSSIGGDEDQTLTGSLYACHGDNLHTEIALWGSSSSAWQDPSSDNNPSCV